MKISRLLSRAILGIRLNHIFFLYGLIVLSTTIQCYYGTIHPAGLPGRTYPNYNNYILFRNSFFHLIQGKNLYLLYLNEQWDLYKYSPSFSALFGILAYMPDFIGLLCWNLLNALPLAYGLRRLKGISDSGKIYALLFCLIELMGSLQNAQSNGLTAGLLILTFMLLEERKYIPATLLVVISIFIKLYGGVGLILFLFYPSKKRLLAYSVGWFLLIGLVPLLWISPEQLIYLYQNWLAQLYYDRESSVGMSVMGMLRAWFGWNISKNIMSVTAVLLYTLPLFQFRKYRFYDFRLLILAFSLIAVVIFNHKAESNTYIIAVCGMAIWFFCQPATSINNILMLLAFIFTTVATGDLVPESIRHDFIRRYNIKGLFSVIIFFKIGYELFYLPLPRVKDIEVP